MNVEQRVLERTEELKGLTVTLAGVLSGLGMLSLDTYSTFPRVLLPFIFILLFLIVPPYLWQTRGDYPQ